MLIDLSAAGRRELAADRLHREGWLARAIADELSDAEHEVLARAVELLQRQSESVGLEAYQSAIAERA